MRRAKARLLTRPDATTILIFRLYLLARNSADKSLNKFRLHRVPSVLTAVSFAATGSSPTSGVPIRASGLGWDSGSERLIVRVLSVPPAVAGGHRPRQRTIENSSLSSLGTQII